MSPARSRRTAGAPPPRAAREVVTGRSGAASPSSSRTALMIWLLRPGPPGIEGTGGLVNRQPRATWLVASSRSRGRRRLSPGASCDGQRRRRSPRAGRSSPIALRAVAGRSRSIAGIVWPGGLLRHTEPVPPLDRTRSRRRHCRPSSSRRPGRRRPARRRRPRRRRTDTTVAPTPTSATARRDGRRRSAARPLRGASIRSRSTRSSAGPSTRSTPGGRSSSRRRPARARRSSPSTRSPRRSSRGGKTFYTTPLKALSNQKFGDFVRDARRGQRRPAHRRQRDQRRRADRRDDDRSAAQHDLRRARRRSRGCATWCSTRCTTSRTRPAARSGKR